MKNDIENISTSTFFVGNHQIVEINDNSFAELLNTELLHGYKMKKRQMVFWVKMGNENDRSSVHKLQTTKKSCEIKKLHNLWNTLYFGQWSGLRDATRLM